MFNKKVVIVGGGVAGLSAAHELINRGFQVEVYEASGCLGGKARSVGVPGSGKNGRKDLPGEHGFRFFPRFYKHITATMNEIPFDGNSNGVLGNLTETTQIKLARFDKGSVVMPARFPRSLKEFEKYLNDSLHSDLGLTEKDKSDFALKVWELLTSCKDRRRNEYERIGWWEYLDSDNHSEAYQTIFSKGLTRTLVAARAETASTKTGGNIFLQLMFDIASPGTSSDRILNAPTNEAWINPWENYLKNKGVKFYLNSPTVYINTKDQKVDSIKVVKESNEINVSGDYYLFAVPVEVMADLLNLDVVKIDPTLNTIKQLSESVSWMNGAQFYLTQDVQINQGHTIYIDTPWAITSISQKQFWSNVDLNQYGDGTVKGILSVDISDWDTPGILYNRSAKECAKEEIIKEIWEQLKRSLNVEGQIVLKDDMLHDWYLDADIEFDIPKKNREPLLVNTINSWDLRPYAYTRIPNLFLASDYVKTYTDLATMEGANEAARRAVNCIIDVSGMSAKKCKVWDLHEPWIFAFYRWKDKRRYKKGLPWHVEIPWIMTFAIHILVTIKNIFTKKRK